MRSRAALLIPVLCLSACATAPSDPVCPKLAPYTAAQQAEAAKELNALPLGAELRAFVSDYGKLRDETRVCLGQHVPR